MSEEHPILPVRVWWWLEDNVPGLLAVERAYFHLKWAVRHPVIKYRDWRKWHTRPKIGDQVEDCRYEIHTVVAFLGGDEDTLLFEDGHSASWMHCCNYPGER